MLCELGLRAKNDQLVPIAKAMAETEVEKEMPSEQQPLAEEVMKEYDYEDGPYNSDDSDFEIVGGPQADRKVWNKYLREWRQSEGFDISVFPGCSYNATIIPDDSHLYDPEVKKEYTDLCILAIQDFNTKNAKNYEFQNIVSVNISYAAGILHYFTFQAKDTDASKTFQARVWDGVDGVRDVELCRLKKLPTDLGDEGPSHSSDDVNIANV